VVWEPSAEDRHGLIPAVASPRALRGPDNFTELLDRLLAERPDDDVVVGGTGRLTASQLEVASNRFANLLSDLAVVPGSRIAVSLPNDLAVIVTFLGAMKAGAIWVGLNRALARPEKEFQLRDSGASLLVADTDTLGLLSLGQLADLDRSISSGPGIEGDELGELLSGAASHPIEVIPDPLAPAAIAYTSGTTGRPKGAVHTQHNILLPGKVAALRSDTGDLARGAVLGAPLPLTILNMQILGPVSAFIRGQRLVAMDRTDAVGLAEWIAAEAVETFHAVPTMVHDLLTSEAVDPRMLDTVTGIRVGGAAMPEAFHDLYLRRFGERAGAGYGLTENPTSVTGQDVTQPPIPGSSGRALPQLRVHILDDGDHALGAGEIGEICVGPATEGQFADVYRPMLGYWNHPEESRAALRGGLLHTGDLGRLDETGQLFVVDRRNDLIVRGGANVYPAEVERVLHTDQRVVACAVVGLPDERLGERVVAVVQPSPDDAPPAADLIELCRQNLAAYKVPEAVRFVEGFERTPMGKIRKQDLRVGLEFGDTSP
jgi:long-chain acyl-CoA synthetase